MCIRDSSGGADLLLYSAADALLAAAIGFGLRKFAPERPGMGTLLVGAAVAAAPVSYTHLDVYKRQAGHRAGAGE